MIESILSDIEYLPSQIARDLSVKYVVGKEERGERWYQMEGTDGGLRANID